MCIQLSLHAFSYLCTEIATSVHILCISAQRQLYLCAFRCAISAQRQLYLRAFNYLYAVIAISARIQLSLHRDSYLWACLVISARIQLSLRRDSYLYMHFTISARIQLSLRRDSYLCAHFRYLCAEIAISVRIYTRLATSKNLFLPRVNSSSGKSSLKFIGPKVWSSIPDDIKFSTTFTFK